MNLFELMTLNNYGKTKEVLFTSTLSYLLNPGSDHGLGDIFLKKLLAQLEINDFKLVKISSEKNLGQNIGTIDIYIEIVDNKGIDNIIGIEAKIWDDSANNKNIKGEAQLVRYCKAIKAKAGTNNNWTLVFLIPYESAPTCIEEFEKIKEYQKNVKLLTWAKIPTPNTNDDYLKESIQDILETIIKDNTIDIQDRTAWILKSIYDYIPKFVREEKTQNRFPSRDDLKTNCHDWCNLLNPFIDKSGAKIHPLHTTIGIPYGTPPAKSEYGNTLFKIRTTKKYYENIAEKKNNYPDKLEIEIWPEVYNEIITKHNSEWITLLDKWKPNKLIDSIHINAEKDEPVKLLVIELSSNIKIVKKDVDSFKRLLREGFEEVLKKNDKNN
jgi:hypothetical protein